MQRIRIVLLFSTILFSVCLTSLSAEEISLKGLIAGLNEDCSAYRQSALDLLRSSLSYKEGKAGLLPALSFSVPASLHHTPRTPLSGLLEDVELENSRRISLSPELTLTQYLPTAGTLGFTMSHSLTFNDTGGISPESYADDYDLEPSYAYTPSLTITLTQPVVFDNVYNAAVTLVEENWAIARSNFILSRNLIIYGLCESFHNLLQLQRNLNLLETRLETAQNSYAEVEKNYQMGQVAQIMFLKAEADLKKSRLDLQLIRGAYLQALDDFSRAYGVEQESCQVFFASVELDFAAQVEALHLPEPPESPDGSGQITTRALSSNIQLVIARKQQELARAGVSQARAREAPLLNIGAGFTFGAVEGFYPAAGEAFKAPFGEDRNPAFFLNLSVKGKIFDGGGAGSRVLQAENTVEQSSLNLAQKEDEIRRGAGFLIAKLTRNRENLEYMQLNRGIKQFEYDKGVQDFQRGLISRVQLEALKLGYDTAVLACMQPEADYTLTRLELLMFVGEDLQMLILEEEE